MRGTAQAELERVHFREVLGHLAGGVSVIAATHDGRDHATIASAVTSLSAEPPTVLVGVDDRSATQEAITRSRAFAVSVLAEDLAARISRGADDELAGLAITREPDRLPLIRDALAVLECSVSHDFAGAGQRVFVARVLRAAARPVDRRVVEQAFRARTAIELGAAELTVGRVSSAELRELRDRAWATAVLVAGGRLVDVDAYAETDAAFHEYLVGLAESDALVAAYRRLSLPALMTGLLRGYAREEAVLSREHLALVDAFEAGSLDEVRNAIREHNDHAQAISEAAVLARGERI
jgi:flavin reductase (DIM6/NTAB) family NADH-FMN oxidoreductase RutF